METFLIKAAQLILALSILVIIHEFGHFLFARIFGVRVEKFYIFFDPWLELFKWKPKKYVGGLGVKKKLSENQKDDYEEAESKPAEVQEPEKGDKKKKRPGFWRNTEYGIGWLPFGGYCKISGMIDESMDTEQMSQPAKDWEFRSKPAWQRLLVMIAGVLFNFLLAILIYASIVFATGEQYVAVRDAKMGFAYSPEAQKIGFRDGDIPLYADGTMLENPVEARMAMVRAKSVEVLRGNDTVSIKIPSDFLLTLDKESKEGNSPISFLTYRIPTKVTQVAKGEGAHKAGILVGDEIIGIDSIETPSLDRFFATLEGHGDKTVQLTVLRKNGAATDTLHLPVHLSSASKMGVGLEVNPTAFYETKVKHYNLFESVPRGWELGITTLSNYASSMKLVFTKEGAKSIGGFGAIGSIFPEKWDWIAFWNIAAFLSVVLAFMNLLPIPALDGGHVLFLLYEIIFRKPAPEKLLTVAQIVGMVLLIGLLLYANAMDIVRLFIK